MTLISIREYKINYYFFLSSASLTILQMENLTEAFWFLTVSNFLLRKVAKLQKVWRKPMSWDGVLSW